ncbi:MAG: PaaI family thioesterase [Pseudomonadales bacterium]|nr:PaaI family thioesterase [Pseudomonadales bacterium]
MNPEQYQAPQGYQHWDGDNFEDLIGPFFFRMAGDIAETVFRVQTKNCNGQNIVHGGALMTFADYTLCIAATQGGKEPVVTVTCNNEFIGAANEGDLVRGRGEVIRRGGSLIFTRVVLTVNEATVLTASAVVKRLRKP